MGLFVLNKNYLHTFSFVLIFFVLILGLVPYFTLAAEPLVPCGRSGGEPCRFSDLEELFQRVMSFLLWTIMVPLATIAIAYVGIQYVTAVGDPGKLQKAKGALGDVLLGIFIALAAWLIINTIFFVLTGKGLPSISV